ncbi:MAG: response regulator [Patescibacteria group bacterium]
MSHSPKSILIVEDDGLMRASLARQFTEAGYAVTAAADGEEAVKALDHETPDVVLCDIILPKLDGIEVLEYAMAQWPEKHIPFIMLTTSDDIGTVARAMDKGALAYLLKSDNQIDVVVKVVETKLGLSPRATAEGAP